MPPARISLFLAVVLLATSQVLAPPPPPSEGSSQSSDNYLKLRKLTISERSLEIQYSQDTPTGKVSVKISEGDYIKSELASFNTEGDCVRISHLDPNKPYTVTLKPANSQKTTEIKISKVPASLVDARFDNINGVLKLTWNHPGYGGLQYMYATLEGRYPFQYLGMGTDLEVQRAGRLSGNVRSLAHSLIMLACNVRGCSDPVFVKGPKWIEEQAKHPAPPAAPADLRCEGCDTDKKSWKISWTHPDTDGVKFRLMTERNGLVQIEKKVSDGRLWTSSDWIQRKHTSIFVVMACTKHNTQWICSDPALVKGPGLIMKQSIIPLEASEQNTQQEVAESGTADAAAGLNREVILDADGLKVRNIITPSESASTFPAWGSSMPYSGQGTLQGTAQANVPNPTMESGVLLDLAEQVLRQMGTCGTSFYSPQDDTDQVPEAEQDSLDEQSRTVKFSDFFPWIHEDIPDEP